MTKEKRMMTVILLRLARELNVYQNKLAKDEDYDYSLQNHINRTIYAISEVHSIASLDPIDKEIFCTALDYLERKINMRQCLEGISLQLAEFDDGRK